MLGACRSLFTVIFMVHKTLSRSQSRYSSREQVTELVTSIQWFSFYTLGHIRQFKFLFYKKALNINECSYTIPLDFLFSKLIISKLIISLKYSSNILFSFLNILVDVKTLIYAYKYYVVVYAHIHKGIEIRYN